MGIKSVLLFVKAPDNVKDNTGKEAWNPDGLMQQSIKAIKNAIPEIVVMTDVALAASVAFQGWRIRWQERLSRQLQGRNEVHAQMRRHNPAFIPRNHKVEEALAAATEQGDLSVTENLLAVVTQPFNYTHNQPDYSVPAPTGSCRYQTFCGT